MSIDVFSAGSCHSRLDLISVGVVTSPSVVAAAGMNPTMTVAVAHIVSPFCAVRAIREVPDDKWRRDARNVVPDRIH